jgi:hypothetical protein
MSVERLAAELIVSIGTKAVDCARAQFVVRERKLIGDRRLERAVQLMDSDVVALFADPLARDAVLDSLDR